jgi:hypothetical protein
LRRLTARAAVPKELPVRTFGADLHTAAAFIVAIVPLDKITIDFGDVSKTRELARSGCAL